MVESDQAFFSTAHQLADIAGEVARQYFRHALHATLKSNGSIVTEADLAIEKKLRSYLQDVFPQHDILGEEYQSTLSKARYTWVIDPIDGTTSFVCGKPTFCTLIALLDHGKPFIGIIDQPISQERWSAVSGNEAYFNQTPLAKEDGDSTSIRLNCTTPLMFNRRQQQQFKQVQKIATLSSFGGDGYAYGLMASGFIDIILEADLQFYDVASLIPVIEGAGGRITDWQGQDITAQHFNGTILATRNHTLHKKILGILN